MTTYAVAGATGQLGQLVLGELLGMVDAADVVAIGRDPSKLSDFAAKGVDVRSADYDAPKRWPPRWRAWTGCCSFREAHSASVRASTRR